VFSGPRRRRRALTGPELANQAHLVALAPVLDHPATADAIRITAAYGTSALESPAFPPPDAQMLVKFTIEVRLEAYDGRAIPADAITITVP
jgi:hypothetical protein